MARIIERNTTVPTSRKQIFTTTRDDQPAVKIRVLQGESARADENDLLGEFILTGIREAKKGEPEIEVTFDIDANGIVSVSARDLATNQEQSIQVNPRGTLAPEELDHLVDEYGTDSVEMHEDALASGDRVLIVDDLIATGGTAQAVGELSRRLGATVTAYLFQVELSFLNGREKLAGDEVLSLLRY